MILYNYFTRVSMSNWSCLYYFWSCLIVFFQVAYLKLDVPLVELWLRITRVQFVLLYQEKGNDAALQNQCVLFSLFS